MYNHHDYIQVGYTIIKIYKLEKNASTNGGSRKGDPVLIFNSTATFQLCHNLFPNSWALHINNNNVHSPMQYS